MRNYLIIDGTDSSIATDASQFDFTADTPTSSASLARQRVYEEIRDLIIAQRNIGLMYERGWGEAQSYVMAAGWYDRALSHGLADAQAEGHLGVLLGNGLGILKNTDRAAQLLEHSHNDNLLVLLKHNRLPPTFDGGADPATAQLAASLRTQDAVEENARSK
jgi:TPR repeat protein